MGDDASDFGARLREAMGAMNQNVLAQRARVSKSTLSRILQGQEPRLDEAVRLAAETGANLMWLATGKGAAGGVDAAFVSVPIYDVRFAAGVASFADAADLMGEMPFDRGLLRDLGRIDAEGLGVFPVEGDSMTPLIADGARALVDLKSTRLREGIFAFRTGDELRIKRLRRLVDGIQILSENPIYEPELVTGDAADDLTIIGRVLWTGTAL
jgi:phage repressor protein C with HTH and peptisase S24 domain